MGSSEELEFFTEVDFSDLGVVGQLFGGAGFEDDASME
jgi:hypothetical protein